MLLEQGYNDLGIQALLNATATPKGSFYHHFKDKEDFALQVIDAYMTEVHGALDHCLGDESRPPLERVRHFFEMVQQKYKEEGYLGCLLGGLGQELSGISNVFSRKIDECLSTIAKLISTCLGKAQEAGDLRSDLDTLRMASLLVDCWEGAALRSRLRGNPAPLAAMLDFYFASAANYQGAASGAGHSSTATRRPRKTQSR